MTTAVTMRAFYRVNTPMFLSGANQDACAELRAPSIKGALRFWWRATQWARIKSSQTDSGAALHELHKQEAAIFGSASGGQSQILLTIRPSMNTSMVNIGLTLEETDKRPGAIYLGYGVMDTNGRLTRSALRPPLEIIVEILCRDGISKSVLDASKLFGLLGGLGSKVRKGYGSVTLTHLKVGESVVWHAPKNTDEYIKEINSLLSSTRALSDPLPFSAFSGQSRMCILFEHDDPMTIVDDYGRQMMRYRSWGNGGSVNGELSEQNFDDDHGWYYGRPPKADFHPRRVIFGLPHNYFGNRGVREVSAKNFDRRASPLWFHVHDFGEGRKPRYVGIATVLHSQFLPTGEQIDAGGKPVHANADYGVIDEFLDGYVGHRDAKTPEKYFPEAQEVLA